MKPTKRRGFNFMRSYFDVMNKIDNPADRLQFLEAVINKSFLDDDPKELSVLADFGYESQRHFIEQSIKGYKDKMKTDLKGTPLSKGVGKGTNEGVGKGVSKPLANKSKSKSNNKFIIPDKHEIQKYFTEKGHPEEAKKFFYFYDSKDWMINKTQKMSRWKSSAGGWCARLDEPSKKQSELRL